MDHLIEQLQSSPHAKLIIEKVSREIEKEKAEREKYYQLIHEDTKAEFINGRIIYQSPVKKVHWVISANLSSQLITHVQQNKLGLVAVEKAMISLSRNDYEPDICFFRSEVSEKFTDEQMHFPAPDFVVEILSASTESIDRNEKMIDYAAHGVSEYWIVDPVNQAIEKYYNAEGAFKLEEKVKEGMLRSEVIEGFGVDVKMVFS